MMKLAILVCCICTFKTVFSQEPDNRPSYIKRPNSYFRPPGSNNFNPSRRDLSNIPNRHNQRDVPENFESHERLPLNPRPRFNNFEFTPSEEDKTLTENVALDETGVQSLNPAPPPPGLAEEDRSVLDDTVVDAPYTEVTEHIPFDSLEAISGNREVPEQPESKYNVNQEENQFTEAEETKETEEIQQPEEEKNEIAPRKREIPEYEEAIRRPQIYIKSQRRAPQSVTESHTEPRRPSSNYYEEERVRSQPQQNQIPRDSQSSVYQNRPQYIQAEPVKSSYENRPQYIENQRQQNRPQYQEPIVYQERPQYHQSNQGGQKRVRVVARRPKPENRQQHKNTAESNQEEQYDAQVVEEEEKPDRLTILLEKSGFNCLNRKDGYYADEELGCEVFHFCQDRVKHSWLCPNEAAFHQVHLICLPQSEDNICAKSSKFHFVNDYLYKESADSNDNRKTYIQRYYPEGYEGGISNIDDKQALQAAPAPVKSQPQYQTQSQPQYQSQAQPQYKQSQPQYQEQPPREIDYTHRSQQPREHFQQPREQYEETRSHQAQQNQPQVISKPQNTFSDYDRSYLSNPFDDYSS